MLKQARWIAALLPLMPLLFSPGAWAGEPGSVESFLSKETRLLVIAPHPDDESLGAGGVIQRVLALGGKAEVLFMTNGDGYPEGVEREDHVTHPKASDYRKYGVERTEEALSALAVLGVSKRRVTFLGFPDGGLCHLLHQYRADSRAYTSPFTKENQPPPSEVIIPRTEFNGQDLEAEVMRVLARFRPTLAAVTMPEDEHPDHCATFYFTRDAIADLAKKDPTFNPRVFVYLVHFKQWPLDAGGGSRMNPPADFPDPAAGWLSFPLKPAEELEKRKAILEYRSQMLVTGRYLLSFARSNELFIPQSRTSPGEARDMPCCWNNGARDW